LDKREFIFASLKHIEMISKSQTHEKTKGEGQRPSPFVFMNGGEG
jgi:hypothetical protein